LNLALVILGPLDRRSGGYSYDADLVEHCRSLGHDVEVWSLSERSGGEARRVLKEKLSADDRDFVLYDALIHPPVVGLLERERPFKKAVWLALVHHLAWQERPETRGRRSLQNRERRFLRVMDGFVANSEDTRKAVKELLGQGFFLPSVVCRPPVSAASSSVPRDADAASETEGRLLFVGNVIPRKNLLGVLNALVLLARRRPELVWSLTVVGAEWDPAYARRCRRLSDSPALAGRVVWSGRVGDAELDDLWSQTDLLAVPSFHEGWGMVYAEALARGIPALAVAQGAAPEVLGNAGLWSPGHDPVSLAETLEAFLESPVLRTDLARNARLRGAAQTQRPPFEGLDGFFESLRGRFASEAAGDGFDFHAYLAAKIGVDSRSLHPRVADSALSLPVERVVELGGGTGTMAERLRSWGRLGPGVGYELVDLQTEGLAVAQVRCSPLFSKGNFTTRQDDLLAYCEAGAGSQPDLVIAHAVLDLFDADTAARALALLGGRRYWLTNLFDGLTAWEPILDAELDRTLAEAYHRTMEERGAGAEGGPRSGRDWLAALPRAGFHILDCGPSDWIVRPDQGRYREQESVFLASMLHFFRSSLSGRGDVDQSALGWWLAARQTQIETARASLVVHQLDVSAEWKG
jgi:glycosyltransferase involved in cell wall biosynthesis